ncbi:hypothetical protein F5Y08DRAFT_319010 [Xylaria arbuscula]|nr:hypothetical protein F5Y08DRAFT_319010 [Xylaria arbuscula]
MSGPTLSGTPLVRWLKSALPKKPFIYHDRASRQGTSRDPIYASLVESIEVEQWHELNTLPDLWHLALDRDHRLDEPIIIFDAFRVLSVEANLEHFLNQSLVYHVNVALHHLYKPPITIIPHVPFTAPALREGSIRSRQIYTPDYTVCKGYVEEDPQLLDDHRASFLVGDAKLVGPEKPKDAVSYTEFLSSSALGQLLWYCVCRKTRFAFHVSNRELVLMEFVVGREDSVAALSDAVVRAESELSSPSLTLPFRDHPQPSKRKYTGSSASNSTVSPSDRHQQKRSVARIQIANNDKSPTTSPTLPGDMLGQSGPRQLSPSADQTQQPQDTGPQTPDTGFKYPEYSSSPYIPSSPGEISAETIAELASAGGDFTVRLHSFPFRKQERLPLALVGFIWLAELVDIKRSKNISATPINVRDYLVDEQHGS